MNEADEAMGPVIAYLIETKAPARVVAAAMLVKDVVHEDKAFSSFAATYKTAGPLAADAKWRDLMSEVLYRAAQRRAGPRGGSREGTDKTTVRR